MNKTFKYLLILSIFILAIGCTHPGKIKSSMQLNELPKGSIQATDDLYYIPIKKDEDGCMMYRPYSKIKKTAQAILYQNSNGKFSMNKNREDCK